MSNLIKRIEKLEQHQTEGQSGYTVAIQSEHDPNVFEIGKDVFTSQQLDEMNTRTMVMRIVRVAAPSKPAGVS